MKTKLIAAAVGVGVLVLTGLLFKAGNEDQTRKAYDAFKESFGLEESLSEGAVSFGFFSGVLTVEQPELRERAQRGYAEIMTSLKAYSEVFGGMGQTDSSYGRLIGMHVRSGDAIALKAEKLEIKADGDGEEGVLEISLSGIDMGKPFLTQVGSDLVSTDEIADELVPSEDVINARMRTTEKEYEWQRNAVNHLWGVGNWIINGTGAFAATADARLSIAREDSGEGEMSLTITHYLDGSKIGEIKRVIAFEKMPDLETMVESLKASGQSLMFAAAGGQAYGGTLFGPVFEGLARKSMVSEYTIQYSGYDLLKEAYEDAQYGSITEFCEGRELNKHGLLTGAKKDVDDSECAIAGSLIEGGSYTEKLIFNGDKPLYPQLAVSKKYEISIN